MIGERCAPAPGNIRMIASLTTHVLDLGTGRPAAGMTVALFRIEGASETLVTTVTTNADGRTEAPLLAPGAATGGVYELRFHVADYLGTGQALPFLGVVPIRFGLDAAGGHYHVPLLVSAYGYSTYRGS